MGRLPRGDDVLRLLVPLPEGSLGRDPGAARVARPRDRRAEPLLPRSDARDQYLLRGGRPVGELSSCAVELPPVAAAADALGQGIVVPHVPVGGLGRRCSVPGRPLEGWRLASKGLVPPPRRRGSALAQGCDRSGRVVLPLARAAAVWTGVRVLVVLLAAGEHEDEVA